MSGIVWEFGSPEWEHASEALNHILLSHESIQIYSVWNVSKNNLRGGLETEVKKKKKEREKKTKTPSALTVVTRML